MKLHKPHIFAIFERSPSVQPGFIVFHAFLQSSMMINILTSCSGQLKHPLTQYPSIFECQLDFLIQP